MGDSRFEAYYLRVRDAADRVATLADLTDEEVVYALAAASRARDPLLANVLATEAANRVNRQNAAFAITESMSEAVVAVDHEGVVTFVNPKAEELLGLGGDALIGTQVHATLHGAGRHPEPGGAAACALLIALASGKPHRDDDAFSCRGGGWLPVVYSSSPLLDEGAVEGAVLVFRRLMDPDRAGAALARRAGASLDGDAP